MSYSDISKLVNVSKPRTQTTWLSCIHMTYTTTPQDSMELGKSVARKTNKMRKPAPYFLQLKMNASPRTKVKIGFRKRCIFEHTFDTYKPTEEVLHVIHAKFVHSGMRMSRILICHKGLIQKQRSILLLLVHAHTIHIHFYTQGR